MLKERETLVWKSRQILYRISPSYLNTFYYDRNNYWKMIEVHLGISHVVDADALVLKHQDISIRNTDSSLVEQHRLYTKFLPLRWIHLGFE